MSYTGYIVWFIAMAVAILAILAFGTLVMADVVHLHHHHHDADRGAADEPLEGEQEHDTHHHWWHRAA